MENNGKQRSKAQILLIVVVITVLGVLVAVAVQELLFRKTIVAVTSAVGVVSGMVAATQLMRKSQK